MLSEISSKFSNKFAVTIAKWKILWKSLLLIGLTMFLVIFPKILMALDWPYPNYGKNFYSRLQMYS